MQTSRLLLAALTSAFASLLFSPTAFGQGALTPPGAPAPTMKTLDQIEARKPLGTPNVVTTSTIVIDEPGSYVLVGPITVASGDGITINASNVTLDLNGFTIASTASPRSGSGVTSSGDKIVVRNGIVQGLNSSGSYGLDPESIGFFHGVVLAVFSAGNPYYFKQGTVAENISAGAFPGYGIMADQIRSCNVNLGIALGIQGGSVLDSSLENYGENGGINSASVVSRSRVGYGYSSSSGAIRSSVIDTCTAGISGGKGMSASIIKHSFVSVASASGTPFTAKIAIGCTFNYAEFGVGSGPPVNVITNRYDMPASP